MIARLWQWLKQYNLLAFFVVVYAVAWSANAIMQTKFNLKEWEELGKYILGKYMTDSGLNSKMGEKP